jgi:hypothetical protein
LKGVSEGAGRSTAPQEGRRLRGVADVNEAPHDANDSKIQIVIGTRKKVENEKS